MRDDYPGVGSQAEQLARLDHAVQAHGLNVDECPRCQLEKPDPGCELCGGTGVVAMYRRGSLEPCGPRCPLLAARPS